MGGVCTLFYVVTFCNLFCDPKGGGKGGSAPPPPRYRPGISITAKGADYLAILCELDGKTVFHERASLQNHRRSFKSGEHCCVPCTVWHISNALA